MKMKTIKKTLADGTVKTYAYESKPGPGRDIAPLAANRMRTDDDDGFVYFAEAASGPIKIGVTRNLRQRIAGLKSHDEVVLLAAFRGGLALERRLHFLFSGHRIRGEWFRPHAVIFREIVLLAEDAIRPGMERCRDRTGRKPKIVGNRAA